MSRAKNMFKPDVSQTGPFPSTRMLCEMTCGTHSESFFMWALMTVHSGLPQL
jgi:hypothetical protein